MKNPVWPRIKFYGKLSFALFVILVAFAFCLYPAGVVVVLLLDPELKATGASSALPDWFEATSARHVDWAEAYLESDMAVDVAHTEVAATEWPMFGSVFYLVTAQELHGRGQIDATVGVIREAVEHSAEIVASPKTATWVRRKWGEDYLEKENLFYRMPPMNVSSGRTTVGWPDSPSCRLARMITLWMSIPARSHLSSVRWPRPSGSGRRIQSVGWTTPCR